MSYALAAGPGGFLRSSYVRWGLIVLLQLGLIAAPLVERLQVQFTGQEVTLELIPVDPRDLLRGDYVIVNLAISRLSSSAAESAGSLERGDRVYVGLDMDANGVAQPAGLHLERAEAGALAIAGTVRRVNADRIFIDYGLDAFFLPEGTGLEIERLPAERVQLVIALSDDGRSLPLRLLVDGEPFRSDAAF